MAIILFMCTLVTAISAAPPIYYGDRDWQKEFVDSLDRLRPQEDYRGKRSGYGSVYMPPCAAAAASSPIPVYAPTAAGAASMPTYAHSAVPYSYVQSAYQAVPIHKTHSYYGHPYYRSEEELESDQETLGFSDMNTFDHMPMARYAYGSAPAQAVGGTAGSQGSGPVVGVFSNSNVGGCSVPLLVSCSPSIAQGRIVKAQPYYGSSSSSQSNIYRDVEDHPHHMENERQKEQASSEHLTHDSKVKEDKHQ